MSGVRSFESLERGLAGGEFGGPDSGAAVTITISQGERKARKRAMLEKVMKEKKKKLDKEAAE